MRMNGHFNYEMTLFYFLQTFYEIKAEKIAAIPRSFSGMSWALYYMCKKAA